MPSLDINYFIKTITGNTITNPETIIDVSGLSMSKHGSYVIVDLGSELFVNKITFATTFSGQNDKLIISSKSLVSDATLNSQTIREINLSQEGSPHTIACSCYARLLIFKHEGFGTLTVGSLRVSLGFTSNFLDTTEECMNYKYLFHDENILTAPDSRVATFKQGRKYGAIALGTSTNQVPVVQVSFNAITSKTTLFKLQRYTNNSFGLTATLAPTGWTDVKTFRVVDYDRLPDTSVLDNGIDPNGMVITGNSAYNARFANNGLVGYVFRPELAADTLLTIVESWTDGSSCYMRVNTDVRELGVVPGMNYFIERPNVVTFPLALANAVQLVQISGGETKVNGFKAYVNLLSTSNAAITPSTGSTLSWALQIESI